jgi:hypothetical protein
MLSASRPSVRIMAAMETTRIVAVLMLTLSCALCAASCAQSPETSQETPQVTQGTGTDEDIAAAPEALGEFAPGGIGGTDFGHLDLGGGLDLSGSGSGHSAPSNGATVSYKTCADMYNDCQEIGGGCTRGFPGCDKWGQSSCGTCYKACMVHIAYPKACRCNSCGFTE